MHKYEDLEKKWLIYKLKRFFIFYIAPALIVIVGVIAYFYFLQSVGSTKEDTTTHQTQLPKQTQTKTPPPLIEDNRVAALATPSEDSKIGENKGITLNREDKNDTLKKVEVIEEIATPKAPKSIEESECFRVNVEALNIRSKPTTTSEVLGKYRYGDIFCALEKAGDWVLSDKGWVFGKNFIEPIRELSPIETPTQEMIPKPKPIQQSSLIKPSTQEIIPKLEINMGPLEAKKPAITLSSSEIEPAQKVEVLKKEFNQNPIYQNALMVAKTYYELGDYQNSKDWALIANEKDPNRPKSWIIFANSLVMLGKKEEAIAVLTSYLSKNNSPEVIDTLNSIKGR